MYVMTKGTAVSNFLGMGKVPCAPFLTNSNCKANLLHNQKATFPPDCE